MIIICKLRTTMSASQSLFSLCSANQLTVDKVPINLALDCSYIEMCNAVFRELNWVGSNHVTSFIVAIRERK